MYLDQLGFSPGMQGRFIIWKQNNAIHHINKLTEENDNSFLNRYKKSNEYSW